MGTTLRTPDSLAHLAAIARALGTDDLARDADALAARVAEGRFYVACVGQFKRGKSTLLNALVADGLPVNGRDSRHHGARGILPTGIVPVTAVPTVVRYDAALGATVRFAASAADGADAWHPVDPWALAQYVAEAHNPENRLGVEAVELCVPASLLADGLCLVDTPGIGSVFAGNTAATRAFVPHSDAALVLVGVDPPLSGDELALVEAVLAQSSPALPLLVVLSKADRFSAAECDEAATFAIHTLVARLGRPVGPVYQVSAAEQLAGEGPPRDWPALRDALRALEQDAGRALVREAHARGVRRLTLACRATLDAQRRALTRPLEDSERRLSRLGERVRDAAQRALDVGHLLAADQQRLGREFADRRATFLAEATPAATAELRATLAAARSRVGPAFRTTAYAVARAVARRRLEPWLAAEQAHAEARYRAATERFVAFADEFLADAMRTDGDDLAHRRAALGDAGTLIVPSRYYFREVLPLTYATPLRTVLDLVRPPARTRRVATDAAAAYLVELLAMNSTLVENDLDQRVTESRRRLEAGLQAVLRGVYLAGERTLARARQLQRDGVAAVADELARLDALGATLDGVPVDAVDTPPPG